MKLLFNKLEIGQNDSESYQFQNYKIKSELKKTARYNHYSSDIFNSTLTVYYKNFEYLQI